MRATLGFSSASACPATCETLWPYLPRLMPRPLRSVGLGDLDAAALYRPGAEVLLIAAECDGLRALAGPGRLSIAALGLAHALDARAHLRGLGEARHGACHRGLSGGRPADGFDLWRPCRLEVTLEIRRDRPVWPTDAGLRVCLPATMPRKAFAEALRDALDPVAVDTVVATRHGRRRCADLGLRPDRYARETPRADGRRGTRARAEDLCFFRPGLDADALVVMVEIIVAGHLLDLVQGIGRPC